MILLVLLWILLLMAGAVVYARGVRHHSRPWRIVGVVLLLGWIPVLIAFAYASPLD